MLITIIVYTYNMQTKQKEYTIEDYYAGGFVAMTKKKAYGRMSDLCKAHGIKLETCMYCRGFQGTE